MLDREGHARVVYRSGGKAARRKWSIAPERVVYRRGGGGGGARRSWSIARAPQLNPLLASIGSSGESKSPK
jgi:hypothetical protein